MALLTNEGGEPLLDSDGDQLKIGTTVRDSHFGDGIVQGTVSILGGGVKVRMEWLGAPRETKDYPCTAVQLYCTLKVAYVMLLRIA